MTKERIEKELSKVDAQLESLQAKKKDLEEQKRMAERAENWILSKSIKSRPRSCNYSLNSARTRF